ncbi:MAG TPA: hypothetical protein VMU29_02170 [Smithella sp.]|nr:hypothetical protein [Smithella sp.]
MFDHIAKGKIIARTAILPLIGMIILINLSGCEAIYKNYIDRKVDPYEEDVKARATRGEINVILLPGCAAGAGGQDTLFSCLKLSRDVRPESVNLPPGEKLYLGHISEFIVRALKYYQLQESFKDFYGCRVVMKFRKLTPLELRSRKFSDYSTIAVGTASTVAGALTMVPVGSVLFLVDGISTEIDRRDFESRAQTMGLPEPNKNMVVYQIKSGGRTLLHVKDEIAHDMTGQSNERMQFDDKVTSYMVEECALEKVTPEEMSAYQEQIKRFRDNAAANDSIPEELN